MKKILFVAHKSQMGGPAHSLIKLIKSIKQSYQIEVLLPGPGELMSALEKEKVNYRIFSYKYRNLPLLMAIILRGRYDLVYGNNFSVQSFMVSKVAKFLGKLFIWHMREVFRDHGVSKIMVEQIKKADAVIAVSEACADSIRKYLPRCDIHVVHNGVEVNDFNIDRGHARAYVCSKFNMDPEDLLVLIVGNIYEDKNQKDAMKLACHFIPRDTRLHFCFLGRWQDPKYANELMEMAMQANIVDKVYLPGFQDEMPIYFRGADIFLHTSVRDAHPRSILEAMASCLPVIAYGVDGVKETVISAQTGYLADRSNINGLANGFEKLVKHPDLRQKMGSAGKKRVEELFTTERASRKVVEIIDQVFQRK